MNKGSSFNEYIYNAIVNNWDSNALTDFQGQTLQFHDVARKIEKIHILFHNVDLQKGEKVAICGRNSAHWAVTFLATLTYGAVAVPILHEFNAEQIHNIVNHSGARLLFVGDFVVRDIDAAQMPQLEGILNLPDFSLMLSRSEKLSFAREHLNYMFGSKFPRAFRKEDVSYHVDTPDELALINYTSGTTGFSKGVMLPYRSLWSNVEVIRRRPGHFVKPGDNILSILPMAHMYGMAFEFSYEFLHGCHVYYLNRVPSPAIIAQAFADVKPRVIIAVPLIIEKIIRKRVFPKIQTPRMRLLLQMPVIAPKVRERICEEVKKAFGGNFFEIIVGGAAFNQEVETFLHQIDFPYTVGYGATECAPIICYADWHTFAPGSCGRAALHMEVKIDSRDPQNVPGEILAKGPNVMLGYYKNPEATATTIDHEGWYHTGDLGTMDAYGNVYINGRSKNMLLGPNGQNIYPEEIEDKLNSMTMVVESIIVQRDTKLVALVHPDMDEAKNLGLSEDDLKNIMEQNRNGLNQMLPAYEKISEIEIYNEEFEKTPKRSIKRYLYT